MSSTIDRPPSSGEKLSAALDEGFQSVVSAIPPPILATPSYPVRVSFEPNKNPNQFWAVPVVGFVAKAIILVPHLIVLALLVTAVMLSQLVLWIPVMTSGQYPAWGETLVGGTMRWMVRLEAYFYGLTDQYPPFTLQEEIAGTPYPVHVTYQRQPTYNQAWAFPVLGLLVKAVLLIPHILILHVLQLVAGVLFLVTWIPVLFTGTYPVWGSQFVGGYFRWATRVYAYLFGLTDIYPPFQLG